jgi:hypothetical protein
MGTMSPTSSQNGSSRTFRASQGSDEESRKAARRSDPRWWQEECRVHSTPTPTPAPARVQNWELGSHLLTGYANFRTRFTKAGSHFWRVV